MSSRALGMISRPVRRVIDAARRHGVAGAAATLRHGTTWRARRVRRSLREAHQRLAARLPDRPERFERSGGITLAPDYGTATSRPRVTIIVASTNQSAFLPIVLRSIQLQDFASWECIVIDDASTDDSVQVVQRFVERDQRIRLFVNDSPAGATTTVRTGLANSSGELVCVLHDGYLLEGSLSTRVAALADDRIVAAFCDWRAVDEDAGLEQLTRASAASTRGANGAQRAEGAVPTACVLVRRSAATESSNDDEGAVSLGGRDVVVQPAHRDSDMAHVPHVGIASIVATSKERPSAPAPSPRPTRTRSVVGIPAIVPANVDRANGAVILVAEAEYHVDEVGPLAESLNRRGVETRFMLGPATTTRAIRRLGAYTDRVLEFDPDSATTASAVVTMKDWGPLRALVDRANEVGVPTLAKVEGVQDFDDVDTKQTRHAYRTAQFVLGQGANDREALSDCDVRVVGGTRLERIWIDSPVDPTDHVLVNLNFTYGVQTEHRRRWLESVTRGVRASGLSSSISAHPAERSRRLGLPRATQPFRHEIARSGVLVSRFSTVPFEAMARGVPFVYHNPHAERVPAFAEPAGAFAITTTSAELTTAILDVASHPTEHTRLRWQDFFLRQVDVRPSWPSEERGADAILEVIGDGRRPSIENNPR